MGFFKAIGKLAARKTNDVKHNNTLKNAPKKTYKEVGKELKKAEKSGKYVNGSELYSQKLKKNQNKENQRYNNTNKFIDDL